MLLHWLPAWQGSHVAGIVSCSVKFRGDVFKYLRTQGVLRLCNSVVAIYCRSVPTQMAKHSRQSQHLPALQIPPRLLLHLQQVWHIF